MRRRNTGTLVVGATFTGLGLAWNHAQEVMVLERTAMPGHEFINACHPGTGYKKTPRTPEAMAVAEEWRRRNILVDGRIHLAGITPLLYQQILDRKLQVLLLHDILSAIRKGEEFCVRISNSGGEEEILCRQIVDTTAERFSTPGHPVKFFRKSLGATLMKPMPATQRVPDLPEVTPGRFDSEAYWQVEGPVSASWPEARRRLREAWRLRPAEQMDWKVAAIATEFVQQTKGKAGPRKIAENWIHIPSNAYSNPLAAFDAGIQGVPEKRRG